MDSALVFNALSGPEAVKAILAVIEKRLLATGEFDGHVTFPWFKYDYNIAMVIYPKQAVDADPGIKVSGTGGSTTGIPSEAKADEIHEVAISDSVIVDTPDLARIESDQPIPTPARGAGNVLVDKLVTPAPPAGDRRPFGYKGTDGKGKSSGTGNQSSD